MDIKRIDHYSIRTRDVEALRWFYTEVIGFRVGPRPAFKFPGLWLYSGEPPANLDEARGNYGIVHIIGVDPDDSQGLANYMGDAKVAQGAGTGALDHIALLATGRSEMVARCRKHRVEFVERTVPNLGLHQVFIKDPSGLTIELNYPASEAPRPSSEPASST